MEEQHLESQPQLQSQIQLENDDEAMPFTNFSFSELKTATKNFSSDEIISKNADESSNIVYKGESESFGSIAVKKLKNMADPDQFTEEAQRVGQLRHKRVVNLIGCCCDGDERFLVAEFLPNDTLAKRLFEQENHTMEWSMRLRVAYHIAEALDHCSTAGFASYSNLSAYTVLFDEDDDACLSCFGLMKGNEDDQKTSGSLVNPESMTYRFGYVLLNLLTGKQIPSNLAILEKDVLELIDPNLEGNFSIEEATIVFSLASQCLQYNDRHVKLAAQLEHLQNNAEVERPSSSPHQCQRPPRKPATRVAGSRCSGPRRKHKTAIHTDEERENQKREEIKKMKLKVAQKSLNKLEKTKAKKEESPSNPGPSTKPRRNQF